MLAALVAAASLAASVPLSVSAAPAPDAAPRRLSMPLYKFDRHAARHAKRGQDSVDATIAHFRSQQAYIKNKYGPRNATAHGKRQSTALTDVGPDSYYYAPVGIGTPAQTLAIVLDTGSSDLWIASNECTSETCAGLAKFQSGSSKTFQSSNTPFSVTYGSGATKGHLVADTVQLADYSVQHQTFAVATDMAQGTLDAPASGLMGLGLQELSSAGVTPFWEVLAKQGVLSQPAFSLQLARNTQATSATSEAPGGIFTLGEIDSSQYSGSINWIDLDSTMEQIGYWGIPVAAMQLNGGNNVTLPGKTAIPDSGTSLIGAPTDVTNSLYAAIQGAQPYGDSQDGQWVFPCTKQVKLAFTFGGQSYQVDPQDFNAGAVDRAGSMCLGAVFAMDTSGSMPNFIVGDSLMKSYFSAFKLGTNGQPAQVGFANLKTGDSAQTLATTASYVTATEAAGASQAGPTSYGLPPLTSAAGNGAATGSQIYYGSGLSSPIGSGSKGVASIQTQGGGSSKSAASSVDVSKLFLVGTSVLASVAGMAWVL